MTSPIIIAINGIMTSQVRLSWPDQFQAWAERAGVRALVMKREYFAAPLPVFNVWIKNRIHAAGIANEAELLANNDELRGESQREIHFVAHSNGTDIALKAIRHLAARGITTQTLIVVGSVLKPDIADNGVCDLLDDGDLQSAVCYASNCDLALRVGRWSFGYSELGRVGWKLRGKDVNQILAFAPPSPGAPPTDARPTCFTRWFQDYGHGEYFAPEHREHTFQLFRKDMGL